MSNQQDGRPAVQEGDVLWTPSAERLAASRRADYERWLKARDGRHFVGYEDLWQWSADDLDGFWTSIWEFFDVQADGSPSPVLGERRMPGAQWFPNARLNYAEHVFRNATDARPAIVARNEAGVREVSWRELRDQVAALAATFRSLGIQAGDRVASYLPNQPETVAAFLACASIGATWSSCAPDMGPSVVLDRLRQIEPKLLLASDSYRYNGKVHDREAVVTELLRELPCVRNVIHLPGPSAAERPVSWRDRMEWKQAVARPADLRFERVPFDHPLWIVYSSGTTGLPKAMVFRCVSTMPPWPCTIALGRPVVPDE